MHRTSVFIGFGLGFAAYFAFLWQGEFSLRETIASTVALAGLAIAIIVSASALGSQLGSTDKS